MTKIAVITDTHAGIKSDAPWMLDHQERFYTDIFFPKLKEQGIKTLFHLGDLFDRRKYINFVTLKRTKEMFLDRLVSEGIHMWIIPGNHDVTYKTTNEVNSLVTLLGEYSSNITILEKPTELTFGACKFLFIPWINPENQDDIFEFVSKSSANILCGHLELNGFDMYKGMPSTHGTDPTIFSKFKEVWTGHFHTKSSKLNVKYLGAPCEFTWADANDPRGFHVFDPTRLDNQIVFYQNPYVLHEKIWYSDDTEENRQHIKTLDYSVYDNKIIKVFVARKTHPELFETFMDKLYQTKFLDISVTEDHTEFGQGLVEDTEAELEAIQSQSTRDLIKSYLDKLDTDLDKVKLGDMISSIYVEAIHLEENKE